MTRISWMLAIAALVSFGDAFAQDNDNDNGDGEPIVTQSDDGSKITIDLEGIGDAIEEAMENVGAALEHAGEALERTLSGTGDHLTLLSSNHGGGQAGVTTDFSETQKAPKSVRVEVENVSGSVQVIGWDRNEIQVVGVVGEDVEELVFDVDGDDAEITVKIPKRRGKKKVKTELTIHVPKGADLEVEAISASIEVTDLTGDELELDTVSGQIRINNCTGELSASTVSGSVHASGTFDEAVFETVSGTIDLDGHADPVSASSISGSIQLDEVSGEVEVGSVSGTITVNGSNIEEFSAESVSGSVRFKGTMAEDVEIDINTVSGTARLELDKEIFGEFDLNSFSGGINVDFAPKSDGKKKGLNRKRLAFEHGDGDAQIFIETFSGSIVIKAN